MRGEAGLSLIILWKGIKATALTTVALVLLLSVHGARLDALIGWAAETFHIDPDLVATRMTRQNVATGALLMLGLSLLYAVQGMGLHWRRRWAVWLTLVPTASLLPLELWRILQAPRPLRMVTLVINMLIVWYLARRIRLPAPRLDPGPGDRGGSVT
jgi:uncharacterized membrane protein (DUF2068 family)